MVRRGRKIVRSALSALVLASALIAGGKTPAQAGPLGVIDGQTLDVTADNLNVDVDKNTAVLQGSVHATLGDLQVFCPKVEVHYDRAPRVRWARGSGGVRAEVKGIEATAAVVEVDVQRRRVTLTGGVRLTRGRGWLSAERATIDLGTRKVSLVNVQGSIPVAPPKR